jgi:hypothetical protein
MKAMCRRMQALALVKKLNVTPAFMADSVAR